MNHPFFKYFMVLGLVLWLLTWPGAFSQDLKNLATLESGFFHHGGWANYGNDPGGSRYSPLFRIDTANVNRLKVAWTFRTGELATYQGTEAGEKAAFEATPIMINNSLYFSTPSNRVFAIDVATGEQRWVYDPQVDLQANYSEFTSRGVSKWMDFSKISSGQVKTSILVATVDGRLIALDSKTGEPVPSFGTNGTVDLREGVGYIQFTSPPAVIGDLIIIGSTMGDNQRLDYPAGVVRALNARTGEQLWSWDPIPRSTSDPGYQTWQGTRSHQTGAANAWAPLSVDISGDLVFVPTSCPSPDYYGGERKGDNLYANSIVALKASTGKVQWHFQTVHHDIWDYDLPAQPLLIDLEREGRLVPAVVVVTKMGHIFVLDRETGKALFPVEERPVPSSSIPGESTSPTQPFPKSLPLLGLRELSVEDAWGPTPEYLQQARERIGKYLNQGIFTPPSFQGTIVTPSNVGGMNWSGASYDPERHLLVTNVNYLAALITLYPREGNSIEQVNQKNPRAEIGRQEGTPYIMTRDYLITRLETGGFVMQTKPPWGTLAAIDLKEGRLKWEVPLGFMMDPEEHPEAPGWGSINMGGATTTAGGLTFIAATMDNYFRAYSTNTGELLWQYELPAGGQATPMTYQVDGRQYVVIAAGGHGKLGTKLGDYLIAFAVE